MMNRTLPFSLCLAAVALAACHSKPLVSDATTTRAEAYMVDTLGREVGTLHLTQMNGTPGVTVFLEIEEYVTPGQHGFHFHSVGNCDKAGAFAGAGGHFNPGNKKHGLFSPDGPHAGDFETITVDDFRHATFTAIDTRISLTPGPTSLLDADGSAIVLHALPDDQRTDPAGNSGTRIACGVIVKK